MDSPCLPRENAQPLPGSTFPCSGVIVFDRRMDPLSISASVIAILGVANTCVIRIRDLGQASSTLLALINEISDLNAVLTQVLVLHQRLKQLKIHAADTSVIALKSLLRRAEDQLLELHNIVHDELKKPQSKVIKAKPLGWARNKERVSQLQQSIRSTRINLVTALGTVNSHSIIRAELMIHTISATQATDRTLLLQILDQIALASRSQSTATDSSITTNPLFPNSSIAKLSDHNIDSFRPSEVQSRTGAGPDVEVKARARTCQVNCLQWCSCACHKQSSFRYPNWLRATVGSLFVGYTGIPVFTPACTETNCRQRSAPSIEITYHFPYWLLSRILSITLRLSPFFGPELHLRMPRMVNWTTPLWRNSVQGDIVAVQMLFASGRASPVDVNAYGQSALHYAADRACIELCRYLLQCKADMYLRDENGRRPIDYAWDGILSNKLGDRTSSELSIIFSDGEYLETRQLTGLHKTVLGLHSSPLKDQLALSTAQINAVDASGRTCLSWAAARGDVASVRTLLDYGANLAIPDMEGCIPLFHAVQSHVQECVELLILKTPNPSAVNVYGSTALHASYMTGKDDLEMVRILLQHGQFDVNLIDFDGDTALNYAARADLQGTARLILSAGADPAIANAAGDTTMHMAVYWKSFGVLEELAKSGADFGFINLRGETALHQVARYSDPRIFKALRHATCLKKIDLHAANREGLSCLDCLVIEGDVAGTEARITRFHDFLNGIGMESDGDDDDDEFEDAKEFLTM